MAARRIATSLTCVVALSLSMPTAVSSQNEEGYQYSNYDNKEAGQAADDNFIITHYGTERYTPVEEAEMRIYNPAGYFKSEVIPVDPISGAEIDGSPSSQKQEQQQHQQWTADGDLLVPLHTGYTLNAKPNSGAIGDGISAGFSIQVSDAVDDGSNASSADVDDETNSTGHRRADDDSAQQQSPSTSSWPKKSENKSKRKKYKEKTIYGFANKPIKELYYYAGDEESSAVDDAKTGSLKRRRHLNDSDVVF